MSDEAAPQRSAVASAAANLLAAPGLLAAFARHPRSYPTYLGYTNGFVYGFGMGASTILFPLYAIDLDISLSGLGIIVAAPAVAMIA